MADSDSFPSSYPFFAPGGRVRWSKIVLVENGWFESQLVFKKVRLLLPILLPLASQSCRRYSTYPLVGNVDKVSWMSVLGVFRLSGSSKGLHPSCSLQLPLTFSL
jgi:hypothetical protein